MNPPPASPEEIFLRLLDESSAVLGAPQDAGVAFPDDDLHREILLPLLPAMLGDDSIRQHWSEQAATGFVARLTRHLQDGDDAPRWTPGDFEIHVTASYSAGPDAKALADTLLSEDSLREMSAALMNQILDAVWPKLALPATEIETVTVVEVVEQIALVPAFDVTTEAAPIPEEFIEADSNRVHVGWDAGDENARDADELRRAETPAGPTGGTPVPLSAMLARRLTRMAIRSSRNNPISGSRTSHGGLGARDWRAGYPLAGCTAQP